MKNYYEILGISQKVSRKQVKSSYRKLIKQFHPDVNPNGAKVFSQITAAYNTLIDPAKRKIYDEKQAEEYIKIESQRKFIFREFKKWILSFPIIRAIFTGRKVAGEKKTKIKIDKHILALDTNDLLQRVMYSNNTTVQIMAVRALVAKNKRYICSDLLRLLYSNINETVKLEIIEGIKIYRSERVLSVLREIYDIEKSLRVRQTIRMAIQYSVESRKSKV